MPISKASGPVQAAIYALLVGDAPLVALVDRIGDSMPEGTAEREYVVLSVTSEVRDRRLVTGAGGNASRLLVSVASHVEDTQDRTGAKTVQAIDQRVVELLDNAELAVDGWTFVSCDYVDSVAQKDGAWRSITSDFEILVEDT
jgi:hypothetical protein